MRVIGAWTGRQDAGGPAAWKAALLGVLLVFAIHVRAQETTTTTAAPEKAKDSALVDASKKAKARKKSPTKVITNADVKKSTGKLVVLPSKPPIAGEETTVKDPRSPLAKQDEQFKQRRDAEDAVKAAELKVGDLQKELNRIEQSFYDEDDATYRDEVIQRRFDQTRRQLDDARKDLSDARDRLSQFTKK